MLRILFFIFLGILIHRIYVRWKNRGNSFVGTSAQKKEESFQNKHKDLVEDAEFEELDEEDDS